MCIFHFVTKFNIFNIFVKFSIFMQNFQYLPYKSSIFMQNLQYLYICVLFTSLSGLCTSGFIQTSGVRERGDCCSGFVLFVSKSSILRICSHIGIFLFSLFSLIRVQVDLCLSFRSQREGISSSLFASFVFLCFI